MRRGVLTLVIVALAMPLFGGSADARHRPKLFTGYVAGERNFEVKPAVVGFTGDATGFLGGSSNNAPRNFGRLTWTHWGRGSAHAHGRIWLNDCTPDCADGSFVSRHVSVDARQVHRRKFRRLTFHYRYHRRLVTDSRKLARHNRHWFWDIPH